MQSGASIQQHAGTIPRIVLVTGANKGIGKEISRQLGSLPDTTVILGCRSEALGTVAAAELSMAGCDVIFQQLDLDDPSSVATAADSVARRFGKLDVLVNNAAVCFNDPTLYGKVPHTPFKEQAGTTVRTNFFGTLRVTQACLPLLRASPSPRLINVASAAGRLAILRNSPAKAAFFTSPALRVEELEAAMRGFVRDVEAGAHTEAGWPSTCYGTSKLGVIALTRVIARNEPRLVCCSVDPGYCATDQNANQGFRSAAQGARTPTWLATVPDPMGLSGKHFFDGAEVEW